MGQRGRYADRNAQEIEKDPSGGFFLRLKLPFTEKPAVRVTRAGDELAISLGNFRRNLVLPRVLATLEIDKARFEGNNLILKFKNGAKG